MEPDAVTSSQTPHHQGFLTDSRIAEIGRVAAPMLEDLSWIERRTEKVVLLDDSALRRQISVDFSLRRTVKPIHERGSGGDIFCAPIFVLPKAPSTLMAFDLEDETGVGLTLISRPDNGRISGAILCELARRRLGGSGELETGEKPEASELTGDLRTELTQLAQSDPSRSRPIASRLLDKDAACFPDELPKLRADPVFCRWLHTFAHSSILVVLYRADGPGRKLIKLGFEEPIRTQQRRITQLGWASYRVAIDSGLIGARSYHFEAQAPPELHITQARLTDNDNPLPASEKGFLRRVHLYRDKAEDIGAATAVLWLAVSGAGFPTGAATASFLAAGALVTCAFSADSIAANPNAAPALLLVLPGLIASYVARPDQHALTRRLLSFARFLLFLSALCAYIAAARVALGGPTPQTPEAVTARADSLTDWLTPLAVIAVVLFLASSVAWLRGRRWFGGWADTGFEHQAIVPAQPGVLVAHLQTAKSAEISPLAYSKLDVTETREVRLIRLAPHGAWVLTYEVEAAADCSLLTIRGEFVGKLPGTWVVPSWRSRESSAASASLDQIAQRYGATSKQRV
jgi:hypothetical protein